MNRIKNFNEYLNEGIRDKMRPKTMKEVENSIRDKNPNEALIIAAEKNVPDLIPIAIKVGADTESKDEYGYTPLILASEYGNVEVAESLIRNGANLETSNKQGYTALIMGVISGHVDIAELLLKNGANINNAMYFANQNGQIEMIKLLKKYGAK